MFHLVGGAKNVNCARFFTVYALHYHLVLVTKYRRKCITGPMLDRLREIIGQRCEDWGGELIEFNGEADHVWHRLPPNLELSRFVNNLKTTSSRLIRRDFARRVPEAYLLAPLLLHDHLRRRPADGAQAVRGEASGAGLTRALPGAAFTPSQVLRTLAGVLAAGEIGLTRAALAGRESTPRRNIALSLAGQRCSRASCESPERAKTGHSLLLAPVLAKGSNGAAPQARRDRRPKAASSPRDPTQATEKTHPPAPAACPQVQAGIASNVRAQMEKGRASPIACQGDPQQERGPLSLDSRPDAGR